MLRYTGERVIPEMMDPMNGLLLEHIARYHFAIEYAEGRVLDLACGVGYGAQVLAKAKYNDIDEVIGVDVDAEVIRYAQHRYYHPKVRYLQDDALDPLLPEKLGTFDAIVSFETLELLADERRFLANVYDMLKPGGRLILSTPFGFGRGKPTQEAFHVHQLNWSEFHDLFEGYSDKRFYYQKGVLIEPPRGSIHYPIGIAVCRK